MHMHCKWIANAMQVHRFSSIFLAVKCRATIVVLHFLSDVPFKVDIFIFRPIDNVVKTELNAFVDADIAFRQSLDKSKCIFGHGESVERPVIATRVHLIEVNFKFPGKVAKPDKCVCKFIFDGVLDELFKTELPMCLNMTWDLRRVLFLLEHVESRMFPLSVSFDDFRNLGANKHQTMFV